MVFNFVVARNSVVNRVILEIYSNIYTNINKSIDIPSCEIMITDKNLNKGLKNSYLIYSGNHLINTFLY